MAKVYGDRICKNCQGLCHENSMRHKAGRRKPYWCARRCLVEWLVRRGIVGEILEEIISEYYEPVIVVSK